MVGALLVVGLIVALFVGINVGGSSVGESFGPTVGSNVTTVRVAAVLMALSALAGGYFVGPHVVHTMGGEIVPQRFFTLPVAIGVLLFTGLGILYGNLREVSVSTSETAVGAIAGMGAALNVLQWDTVGVIVTWWIISPVLAFWLTGVIGRYFYDRIEALLDFQRPSRNTAAKILVLAVACYMGFSAGASNVANAVAPLVGAGVVPMVPAVIFGGLAMGIGAFVIGPRTMKTVGNDITHLPLEAALIVELISATIITALSWAGIPASLAVTTITCVIGLGWGRATRNVTPTDEIGLQQAIPTDGGEAQDGDEEIELFNEQTTRRVVTTWMASPTIAAVLAFVVFKLAVLVGLLNA
jgi:PiT family inorganic phosphate transporter